ncbi:MAG: hypothetical protein U0X39_16550 [Bacteroidales bacterium]
MWHLFKTKRGYNFLVNGKKTFQKIIRGKSVTILLAVFTISSLGNTTFCQQGKIYGTSSTQDTVPADQILYNGRVWRNTYYGIQGHSYLFSKEMMSGSVSVDGTTFNGIRLLYDIYKDELLTITGRNILIVMNKELVDSFTLNYNGKTYRFVKRDPAKDDPLSGYSNELYGGRTGLYVRYSKLIDLRAVDNKYDAFRQLQRIYVFKDNTAHPVKNKHQFMKLFKEESKDIKAYVRKEKLRVTGAEPETFIPLVKYCDTLKK